MNFAVLTPSRGLVHSRMIEAVMANVADAVERMQSFSGWFLTHDLPIPDAHERVCELGLASDAEALWMVEEDVIPPPGALMASLRLMATGAPIVAVDYPVLGSTASIARRGDEIPWCFCGCTLVARRVFEGLARPWFSTARTWQWVDGSIVERDDPRPEAEKRGQQDMYFFTRAVAAGFPISELPGAVAGHASVVEWGKPGTNHGWHRVEVATVIDRQQFP